MAYGFVTVAALAIMPMEKLGGQEEQGLYLRNLRREEIIGQGCRELQHGNDLTMRG